MEIQAVSIQLGMPLKFYPKISVITVFTWLFLDLNVQNNGNMTEVLAFVESGQHHLFIIIREVPKSFFCQNQNFGRKKKFRFALFMRYNHP